MIFVDSNVFIYAVGKPHPLKRRAREWLLQSTRSAEHRVTSSEVLQELLHVYLPVERHATLRQAIRLALGSVAEVWSLEREDVELACANVSEATALSARDLIHLACCQRRGVRRIMTFDRALKAVVEGA